MSPAPVPTWNMLKVNIFHTIYNLTKEVYGEEIRGGHVCVCAAFKGPCTACHVDVIDGNAILVRKCNLYVLVKLTKVKTREACWTASITMRQVCRLNINKPL